MTTRRQHSPRAAGRETARGPAMARNWFTDGNRAARVAAYHLDGWTPAGLRALAGAMPGTSDAGARLLADADALEKVLAGQKSAGKR